MKMVRVLVADESIEACNALTNILNSDNEIQVIGTTINKNTIDEKVSSLKPDVITMDIEIFKDEGVERFKSLIDKHLIPVVLISSWGNANAEKILNFLGAGAVNFIQKPRYNYYAEMLFIKDEIINKVKRASKVNFIRRKNILHEVSIDEMDAIVELDNNSSNRREYATKTENVIVIGASTGGTTAIENVLKKFNPDIPGIVVVQHMPEKFTAMYADRLNTVCKIEVREAKNGDRVKRGTALIAPGGYHCLLHKDIKGYYVEVRDGEKVGRHKPSVNILFRSAANCAGANAVGVILTGMGSDGAQGMRELKICGAYNIAQDEKTSVIFGMPAKAIEFGGVDTVLPIHDIANEVIEKAYRVDFSN